MVFVPLSTVAFATLDVRFRTDATALFSLVRNLGSSIGMSIVTVLMVRNTQINHAELSAFITRSTPIYGRSRRRRRAEIRWRFPRWIAWSISRR